MVILLVTGMMNLVSMAIIAAAITVERLSPGPQLIARVIGFVMIVGRSLGVWEGARRDLSRSETI